MTSTPAPAAPAVPGALSNLGDRLRDWLGEGRAIEDAIENEGVRHRTALIDLETLQAAARDAIDHMRETVGAPWERPRASP